MPIAEQDKPKKRMGAKTERLVDGLGELLGLLTICLIAFLYLESYFNFVGAEYDQLISSLWAVREVAIIVVVGLKGMEIILKGNSFFLFVIYAAVFAVVFIFAFFPDTGVRLASQIPFLSK